MALSFPLPYTTRIPKRNVDVPWLSTKEPQIILFQGERKGGKGVSASWVMDQYYKKGMLILWLWGARSFENLYVTINKNCRKKIEQWKLDNPDKDPPLSCACHKSYPIVWIVPKYIKFNDDSIIRANGGYFKDFYEYNDAWNRREEGILEYIPKNSDVDFTKIKKPEYMIPRPKIVIRKITVPSTSSRKEVFKEEFTEILKFARTEHRMVIMNPAIFDGVTDKFYTLAEMLRELPEIIRKEFKPLTEEQVGKPKSEWSKLQKNHHKICLMLDELKTIAPSNALSGQAKVSETKKVLYDMIPEMRHFRLNFIGIYQQPTDLYPSVRYNSNLVVVKRGSKDLLGSDWAWLFSKVEKDRKNIVEYQYGGMWTKSTKDKLRKKRPLVTELADNQGYITWINSEYKLKTFDPPSWHLKGSYDDFQVDTGIEWEIDKELAKTESNSSKEEKNVKQMKKVAKEDIFKKVDYMFAVEKKSMQQIIDELVLQEKEGIIPNYGFEQKTPKSLSNWYNRQKAKFLVK